MLGLKWAVTSKFRSYLYGGEFVVYTDNPLKYLRTAKLGAVEQIWAAELAPFNFSVEYRAGWSNANTDALSRHAKYVFVKGSHRPRPLTRLRRSLIDKTTPTTLIRTRMHIDEFVWIMAVGDRWRSFLLLSVTPQGRNKMCIGLTYCVPHTIVSIESFHTNNKLCFIVRGEQQSLPYIYYACYLHTTDVECLKAKI